MGGEIQHTGLIVALHNWLIYSKVRVSQHYVSRLIVVLDSTSMQTNDIWIEMIEF